MMVLMFDLCFKNLQFIRDYVGLELAMQVATNYDQEILMPLLLIVYHALTPNLAIVTFVVSIVVELGVVGFLASIKEAAMGFIRVELSLFRRIAVLINLLSPLTRWAKHEQQFPNLTYLA
jgi:hypothetical protein